MPQQTLHDEFFWISTINKATVVINHDEHLLDDATARLAARGIRAVEKAAAEDHALRVKSYIAYEPKLIAATSPEVTLIHAGRSSQDILSTMRTAIALENAEALARALDDVIAKLIALAEEHQETIVPNYTNGVAAQPNSYAHYLLGFIASFLRDRERLSEVIRRYDQSAMGATVLNGTGWPLNRTAMATRLGFAREVRNAFDATCLAPVDVELEFSAAAGAAAIHTGEMINDIMVQYAQPRPWILLQEGGENTYVSSAMPQKRNPGLMNNCRADASEVLSEMNAVHLRAHNVVPGMVDGKSVEKNSRMARTAESMLKRFLKVLSALRINPERALEELNSDWTASQEIADRLMREYGLPFRIGHHVASGMVSWARTNNVLPIDFPYAQAQRIYREVVAAEFPEAPMTLPMPEKELRAALDPRSIVKARRTRGSAAPSEISAMISEARMKLADFQKEIDVRESHRTASLAALEADFEQFL